MVVKVKSCTEELFWIFQTSAELILEYTTVKRTTNLKIQLATKYHWMLYVSLSQCPFLFTYEKKRLEGSGPSYLKEILITSVNDDLYITTRQVIGLLLAKLRPHNEQGWFPSIKNYILVQTYFIQVQFDWLYCVSFEFFHIWTGDAAHARNPSTQLSNKPMIHGSAMFKFCC